MSIYFTLLLNYFAGLDFFPASSLNFGPFCPPEETRLRVTRISHLPRLERLWELGWLELCYRSRFSSAETVNRSFLEVI